MITTPIEIDKHRKLRYTMNSIVDLEDAMGGLPHGTIISLLRMGSFKVVRAVLWAGLKWEDSELTLDGAGNLADQWVEMSGSDIGGLIEVLFNAYFDAGWFNKPENEDEPITLEGDGQGESKKASEK